MDSSQSIGDMYKTKGVVKGKDIEMELDLEFEEAYGGVDRVVEYPCNILCSPCKATGIKPGSKEIKCNTCDGSGYVESFPVSSQIPVQVECTACSGNGKYAPKCLSCSGQGIVRQKVKENINVPKGIYDGLVLRVSGKGN